MEPQACREQFARHLADEVALLVSLEQQLLREHELLTANDIDGLEKASGARQQTVARLLRLDDERRGLCRIRKLAPDNAGLAALLAWCDPTGSLAAAQALSATHAQRCREQNERNGALVTARLNRVNGMLDMIEGSNPASTYQARAGVRAAAFQQPAGRMVSTSA
jgi:flagellar biosynthesis/type III secretory pathway chaperone